MLVGNSTVTAIWNYFADSTHSPEVLGFAQKLDTYRYWSMTLWGLLLLSSKGYAMFFIADGPGGRLDAASQVLFVVAGLI